MADSHVLTPRLTPTLAGVSLRDISLTELIIRSEEWRTEPKLDGVRCLALVGNRVRLQSRAGNDITDVFPEIAEVVKTLVPAHSGGIVLDGELIPRSGVQLLHGGLTHPACHRRNVRRTHSCTCQVRDLRRHVLLNGHDIREPTARSGWTSCVQFSWPRCTPARISATFPCA